MKKIITVLVIAFLSTSLNAQTRYQTEIKKAIQSLNVTTKLQDYKALANKFSRIASVENKKWLPQYYASYCYTAISRFDDENTEKRDLAIEKAVSFLNKAKELSPNNEEITILDGYIAQSRFFIAPASRIPSFAKTSRIIAEAVNLYPNNPRANLIQGIQMYHKPAFLGGGAKKAKPYFEKATKLFGIKNDALKKLLPHWGKLKNKEYKERCQNN